MRDHTALAAWLPTARQAQLVELLTVTKPSGAVWRYASTTDNLVDGAVTYLGSTAAGGLIWSRSQLRFTAGIQLGECTVEIHARETDTLAGVPVATALRAQIWDDATFLLSRAYLDETETLRGILPRFQGQLAPVRMVSGGLQLTLKPPSQVFNRAVPQVYQASCHNTVFDAACGASRVAFQVTGTVQAGSTASAVLTGRGESAGYFAGGVIRFTSGPLVGVSRTVRLHLGTGEVNFFQPLPATPATGTAYVLTPGCDRTLGTGGCQKFFGPTVKFTRFRGTPFIPLPDTAL